MDIVTSTTDLAGTWHFKGKRLCHSLFHSRHVVGRALKHYTACQWRTRNPTGTAKMEGGRRRMKQNNLPAVCRTPLFPVLSLDTLCALPSFEQQTSQSQISARSPPTPSSMLNLKPRYQCDIRRIQSCPFARQPSGEASIRNGTLHGFSQTCRVPASG